MSSLLPTKTVQAYVDALKANECNVKTDIHAGTIVATDDGVVVFRAISKGLDQPWIVTFTESERIKWDTPG